jgi:uncharacterized protein (DUF58 family)
MPTRRAVVIFVLALALYFVANQTQVGWVYMMTDALLALLVVSFIYSVGTLRGLKGSRRFHNPDRNSTNRQLTSGLEPEIFFEDDPVQVSINVTQTGLRPAFMVRGLEICPISPPAEQHQSLFISALFRNQSISFSYQTHADQRGHYSFPPLQLQSRGPFSLFRTRYALAVAGEILVYPKYFPLKRIRLLENRGFTDRHSMRTGSGNEIIGTREYRSGDSLRKIHWRSTARAGRLVVKEFSDTEHFTMTVLLDLSAGTGQGEGKYSSFETAIRIAASLAYFATQQNIPFRLTGVSQQWQPPPVSLSWWGAMHYLARVKNDGDKDLCEVLKKLNSEPFIVVLISQPNQKTVAELAKLSKRGIYALSIFITPDGRYSGERASPDNERLKLYSVGPHNWVELLKTI